MRGGVVIATLLLCGCFSYTPLETTVPPGRGWEVVAKLSTPLDVRLQETTVHDVNLVTGQVVFADPDSVVVAVRRFETASGNGYPGLGSLATFPPSHLAELAHKRVAPVRTGLVIGGAVVAIASILAAVGPLSGFLGIGGGDREQP